MNNPEPEPAKGGGPSKWSRGFLIAMIVGLMPTICSTVASEPWLAKTGRPGDLELLE